MILMLQKIESKLVLSVRKGRNGELVDFSNARNLLFCIKQQYGVYMEFPAQYTNGKLLVTIPYEEAMKLTTLIANAKATIREQYPDAEQSITD